MKIWKNICSLFVIGFLFSWAGEAQAHVVDLVETKEAQVNYEDIYPLIQSYKGTSGVTINSYSSKWNTKKKLQELEAELVRNKHGNELAYLGTVAIFPDYPAGEGVLGQYYVTYRSSSTGVTLEKDRPIYLFGGNTYTTITSMAHTLSHEYGHHFTFYQLLEREGLLPKEWMNSKYAKARKVSDYPLIHSGVVKENDEKSYIWSLPEIMAEDYVQLFGSELALQTSIQRNMSLRTPFDDTGLQAYWNGELKGDYEVKAPSQLYVTGYKKGANGKYDVQLYSSGLKNGTQYVRAEKDGYIYESYPLGSIEVNTNPVWLTESSVPKESHMLLNSQTTETYKANAVQYKEVGFNVGTKTLDIRTAEVSKEVTPLEEIRAKSAANLSIPETKKLLQEVADKKGIPAEILKAIAFAETGMKQFDANGMPIITEDGGIGMMQITMTDAEYASKGINKENVKWDIGYNIEIGANILLEKWNLSYLPKVNKHEKDKIEDWYFAILAYNGASKRNDPTITQVKKPYQEKVFDTIRQYSLMPLAATPTAAINITYPYEDRPDIMVFKDSTYTWGNGKSMQTTQNLKTSQTVYTAIKDGANLRDSVNGKVTKKLQEYTALQIIGGPFETTTNPNNQYVMYQVKGSGFEGYISSSNIAAGTLTLFSDLKDADVASSVAYLQVRGIINGYEDGTYRPGNELPRRHAAQLIVKALDLKLPKGYQVKATDLKPGDLGYEYMAIAEAHNIMGQGGKMRGNESLTRSQMASVLARTFKDYYAEPTVETSFSDVPRDAHNYEDVNTLYFNKITVVNPFRVEEKVTRGQFAHFLKRTYELVEKGH
ncbi:S-layer homology domain-containing protein [Peribacillus loiseleuriae]|uniref:S-layer homology domain-containing protein n=1 Tax=Peribacillus loiseleuriae TaxID=1679170 RepID=UPI003D04727C